MALEAIFYRRLMPASIVPYLTQSRSKTAISAALKEGNFVSPRSWRSVAVQLPGGSLERFRTQLLNDAQGKIGRQMEPEWAETGFEPGFEPIFSRTGEVFFRAPSGKKEFLRRVAAL